MSELLTRYAGNKVSEVPPSDLRNIISDLMKDADFTMSANIDRDYMGALVGWVYKFLNDKYNYMPITHVQAAIEQGSMGHRAGTSKLMPRNIAIWLNEQAGILQEQVAKMSKQEDDIQRINNTHYKPSDFFVATAVRMKVHWLCDGAINGDQYDSFSSKAIYDLLKSGVPEKDIRPRHVVPNYEEENG